MDEKIYQIAEQIVQIYRKAYDVIEGERVWQKLLKRL